MQSAIFQKKIKDWYQQYGRHDLEWRKDLRPYSILVSELMLQQTQVDRVRPKYREFMNTFPKESYLAEADLGTVLKYWQGLGYNRRAKYLWEATKQVVELEYFPQSVEELKQLPGVGPYTAGAIAAFAYNKPIVLIETNVRTVFLHHFFPDEIGVDDTQLLPLIEQTLDKEHPREWYWALMDYGSHLKSTAGNANIRSKQYVRQSKFAGSKRQTRGAILRTLAKGARTKEELDIQFIDSNQYESAIEDLIKEGMIQANDTHYWL